VVAARFPGALLETDYVDQLTDALHQARCRPDNTLVAAAVCRDELSRPLVQRLEQQWGPVFDLSGLAGIPSGGATALSAALSHVPEVDQRSHLVLVGLSHVGVDGDGTIGRVRRRGRDEAAPTCGSLAGVADALGGDAVREPGSDALDEEQIRVENRIRAKGRELPAYLGDLAGLAGLALASIEDDLEALVRRLVSGDGGAAARPLGGLHGGVFTGVQIQRYPEPDLVWPSRSVIDTGGRVRHDVIEPG
jgi:hypothetical protein